MDPSWQLVDSYLETTLLSPDPVLEEALRAAREAGLPPHHVSPSQGALLALLVQLSGARRVVEIGTLGAYSTLWIARALPPGGSLLTLEANPAHAAVARAVLARAGLSTVVTLWEGPALDALARLRREGAPPIDLFFLDADKPNNVNYLAHALALSRPGSLIVADNVVRGGAVVEAESQDPNVLGVRAFLEALGRDPRLSATALQTVGGKGYDGFALARVRSLS